jgi:predicted TIM-barrel fold metal-dependent hydrolase
MRVVALEEHFVVPELTKRIDPALIRQRGFPQPGTPAAAHLPSRELADVGTDRLASMDASGISVQILSLSGPGADLLDATQSPQLARAFNDHLAAIVQSDPDRYAGFAHLPMTAPEAAADELERTFREHDFKGAVVNGTTDGQFLDDVRFRPILQRAEALDVPIYIHPHLPPRPVFEAYYSGLPGNTGTMLSMAGWGWHSEVAIHVLRLVLAGTLQEHPKLKLIIGHMGEGLPAMLQRCDEVFGRLAESTSSRRISQTILDQVWITTSGFFSVAPFLAALLTFGVDRILFSVDYPFSRNEVARDFLDRLPLGLSDKTKIAHANADALLKLRPSS